MRPAALATLLLVAPSLSGCGGGSGSGSGAPPAELVGTYTTTLDASDLPANAPAELEAGTWKLVIATSGAPDDGPSLAIDNPTKGNLEAPGLKVDGDHLTLVDEECGEASGYSFHDTEYSWELSGSTLTLTGVKNECDNPTAETILTSRPWTKS
jgi:hypothetical protein